MRKRFIKWLIKILLPHHHLAKNGPGRRKKVEIVDMEEVREIVEGMGKESPLEDGISADYRKAHLLGKFPGKSMGD